ncbi:hypothetical protein KSF78_0001956, partial [Schistosoma japonicum]
YGLPISEKEHLYEKISSIHSSVKSIHIDESSYLIMAKIGKGIQIPLSWVPATDGNVPHNAVNVSGDIYVIRSKHDGHWIPGKAVIGHNTAYYPMNGQEIKTREYEVLCDTSLSGHNKGYEWESESGGNVPKNAIIAGMSGNDPLYIARGSVNGEVCVGKVHYGHNCAYFPWGGNEHSVNDYEVLVWKKK